MFYVTCKTSFLRPFILASLLAASGLSAQKACDSSCAVVGGHALSAAYHNGATLEQATAAGVAAMEECMELFCG